MKSIISATVFTGALLATSVAFAGHPLLPNGWPVPASQTPVLSDEDAEHREFMNVVRGTFPSNMPANKPLREKTAASSKR